MVFPVQTQEKYEKYYNEKVENYNYIDRGVGYIQTMFKDEYPNCKIDEIKFNHLDYINPVYQELIEMANYNNIAIKHILIL